MLDRLLNRLADGIIAAPRIIFGLCLILVVAAGVYGADAVGRLSPAGYEVYDSESTEAAAILGRQFDTGPANLVVLVDTGSPSGVDQAATVELGRSLTARLAASPHVDDVASPWTETANPALRSLDGSSAVITARILGTEHEVYERVADIRDEMEVPAAAGDAHVTVTIGGSAAANLEIVEESERDLLRAELIAIPVTTIIMVFVFRSLIAALLPLVVSAVAVVGTAAALKGLTEITLVTVFALNLTTALGLGMGVDFSLFTISRWREERGLGVEPDEALRITIRTVGRSILFSGLTTAASLAALLAFDYALLQSLALAGFAVVLLATFGGLVALPATIAMLGDRVDRFSVRSARPATDEGRWHRTAHRVMGRPWPVILVTTGVLLLLGSPFLRAEFAVPDDRALPESSGSRQVADELRAGFDSRWFGAMALVGPDALAGCDTVPAPAGCDPAVAELAQYASTVSTVDGVALVDSLVGTFVDGQLVAEAVTPERFQADGGTWMAVIPEVEPVSPEAEAMVAAIRAIDAPGRFLLGGESARLVDNKAEIAAKLPWVAAWVVLVIGGLLFASFGSVILPIKAIGLNLLSLTAAFGALVWVFQDGRLTELLNFTPTGLIDAQTPVIIFCIAFGLSMDYEVFLLSRIKEEWDRTGDARQSVAVGLERTGSIITAAAILMAVVFLSFATGRVTTIQMVGVGLALSIVADAALVRSLLVPAFMTVAGRWNWWRPSLNHRRLPPSAQPTRQRAVTEGANL